MTRLPKNEASATSVEKQALSGLFVTATPIGNLGDLSDRARASLEGADIIACEDTRHTGMMLQRLGLRHGKMVSYHDHSGDAVVAGLISAMENGKSVTLVSDAGTPLVSDPGFQLVRACHDAGLPVTAIPGPSALLTGLVLSGLPCDRFFFAGFLPQQASRRRAELDAVMDIPSTLIFYESPKRLLATLADLAECANGRQVAVARELTKLHEDVRRGTAMELHAHYSQTPPRGEIVLMLGPAEPETGPDEDTVTTMLQRAMEDGLSRKDAVQLVSESTGLPRKSVYSLALALNPRPHTPS